MDLSRRKALGLIGASAGTLIAGAPAPGMGTSTTEVMFQHGVASGDPLQDRVVLWTRVTPANVNAAPQLKVEWELADDASFRRIVRRGIDYADAERDYTVKVDADGLQPMKRYYYRFRCNGRTSPAGQTQTLPVGAVAEMVLAVASCSHYGSGFFNAYREIANLAHVDLILHLGDYIYEYGGAPDQLGAAVGIKIGRVAQPLNETITLADYRARYACHRRDADLQAAHARAPWICIWDDHETANDSWMGGAQNHQPNEGDWYARRTAAVRAYYEWIPIREPKPDQPPEAINRVFELGNLASLIMVENRLVGRSKQYNPHTDKELLWEAVDLSTPDQALIQDATLSRKLLDAAADGLPVPPPYQVRPNPKSLAERLGDPSRTIYGFEQERWLDTQIANSVASGKVWQVLGNEVIMARTTKVDIKRFLGPKVWQDGLAKSDPGLHAFLTALGNQPPIPFGFDSWDGYPSARARLDKTLSQRGARPIVLSGDSHAFWMNALKNDNGNLVAAEIGTTSITSMSLGDMLGGLELGPAYVNDCEEVLYSHHLTRGFALLRLRADRAVVSLLGVSTVMEPTYTATPLRNFAVLPGAQGGIERIEEL